MGAVMTCLGFGRTARSVAFGIAVLVLAAGCASTISGLRPADEVVLERAQQRWNALVKRRWSEAYAYLTPAFREVVPLDRYISQLTGGPVQWTDAKAYRANCEDRRCSVSVEIFFRLKLKGHGDRVSSTHLDEDWVLDDGGWYKFEKP